MEKLKTPPQPLMKKVVYPFALGIVVYLISSSLFFVGGGFLAMRLKSSFILYAFFFFGYPLSFFVLGPLLTLAFAYQRSWIWTRNKRKIAQAIKQK